MYIYTKTLKDLFKVQQNNCIIIDIGGEENRHINLSTYWNKSIVTSETEEATGVNFDKVQIL